MSEENKSSEFRIKNSDETRNYLNEEINQNEFISKQHKQVCTTLNNIAYFLILASKITECVSISASTSLVGISIGITSSAIGLKICAITAAFKKYRSITERRKKKHDIIVLLAKSKLNSIEVLISKTLIDSVISHDGFFLINNVLKGHDKMKEKIKKLKT